MKLDVVEARRQFINSYYAGRKLDQAYDEAREKAKRQDEFIARNILGEQWTDTDAVDNVESRHLELKELKCTRCNGPVKGVLTTMNCPQEMHAFICAGKCRVTFPAKAAEYTAAVKEGNVA